MRLETALNPARLRKFAHKHRIKHAMPQTKAEARAACEAAAASHAITKCKPGERPEQPTRGHQFNRAAYQRAR